MNLSSVHVFQFLKVVAIENFFVADRAFGGQIEHLHGTSRPHRHLQTTVVVLPPFATHHAQIIATASGTPAAFSKERLQAKPGKEVGQLPDTLFDMLGQLKPISGMQTLEFFLASVLAPQLRFSLPRSCVYLARSPSANGLQNS